MFITAIAIAGLGFAANAQKSEKVKEQDVPAAVQTSFKSEFPDAKDADWKIKDGHYKVDFDVNDVDQIASFDAAGKMMLKGVEIKESELPAAITSAVQSGHAGKNIDDVYKIEKDGATQYLVKFKGNPGTKAIYSADGHVINEK